MEKKLKAGITGFRFENPWDQLETIAKIGYKTSQNAAMTLQNLPGDFSENLARFQELGLEFYSVGIQKPMNFAMMRSQDPKDLCTIREGYADMGMDYITVTDQHIEDTVAACEKFGVKLVSGYSTPILNPHFGLAPCEKDVFYAALEGLEKIAEKFAKYGIRYTYHNHADEFETIFDGLTAFDQMVARTSTLAVEIDVGWVAVGGYDPVAVMKRIQNRIASVHVKDYVPGKSKNNFGMDFPRFTTVGTGLLDLDGVLKEALTLGMDTIIIEQDQLRNLNVKDTLTAAFLNMKETGLVE